MKKIRPFWRIVIGFLIFCVCVYSTNALPYNNNWFGFASSWAFLAAYIFLAVKIKYDDPLRSMRDMMQKKMEQQSEEEAKRAEEERRKREAERKAEREKAEAERAAWNAKHGLFFTNVVGVTFDNDDGTSRQKILRDYYISGVEGSDLNLEEYEYKGKPAVRVLLDDQCVGNIPKNRVDELLPIMDRLEKASIDIEVFTPDEDEDDPGERKRRGPQIYRADLSLTYAK